MNGYLLDTNVISELTNETPDPEVIEFVSRQRELWISSIVVHELEYGVQLLPPSRQRDRLTELNARVTSAFQHRILPVDRIAAEAAARFRAEARRDGLTVALSDALIAGTAMAHDVVVVTRNVRHFAGLDVELINPWGDD